jgi:hypothetical protein
MHLLKAIQLIVVFLSSVAERPGDELAKTIYYYIPPDPSAQS